MEEIKYIRSRKRKVKNIIKVVGTVLILSIVMLTLIIYFYYSYLYKNDIVKTIILIHNLIRIFTIGYIISRKDQNEYKLNWILVIFLIPIIGIILYYSIGNTRFNKKRINKIKRINEESKDYLKFNFDLLEKVNDKDIYKNFNYISNTLGYPLYKNEGVEYFETGNKLWDDMLEKLKRANNYILIDFYMISEGDLLDDVLDILFSKAKEKVDIKIIYDFLGAKKKIPKNFKEKLAKQNIEVLEFNKSILRLNKLISFRDHRKIVVIDGEYAYTGGINIADEYVNKDEKFGYWKDGGIRISGIPITSYIVMFGRMYTQISGKAFEYYKYIKQIEPKKEEQGFLMCVEKTPENIKNPLENMFINFIYSAKKYIYIATPYMILSESMINALSNASQSGIDVKIVVPMTPDKIGIYKVTKSFYEVLKKSNIEIYEYSLGFIHSKLFLIDGVLSSCGSVNMDFRSFNLNYECTTITYNTLEEEKIKKDFNSIIKNSKCITLDSIINKSIFERIIEGIFSVFKSLM